MRAKILGGSRVGRNDERERGMEKVVIQGYICMGILLWYE